MTSIRRITRVLAVSVTMCGCPAPSPCPQGAALMRSPDPRVDGGTAALCRTPKGTLDGPVTLTWDGTRPQLSGRFEQGRPVGAWTWWHELRLQRDDLD